MSKLLVIGYVWPEPKSSAAGARMMQLLEFFRKEGYSVIFGTTATRTEHSEDLEKLGISTEVIELNNNSFDLLLKELQPNIVLFDRFMMEEQFGWRVAEVCPEAIRILDTEDLHFLRKARQQAFKQGVSVSMEMLQSETAKREIASIYRCDLSLIISEAEMDLLTKEFRHPPEILFYIPFLPEEVSSEEITHLPDFDVRRNFVSIGNFLHEPNWDAVLYLKQEIWPLIKRELPAAELHIYGAYSVEKVKNLHNQKEGFIVKGRAPEAIEMLKHARVLLAPLRFGAGQKGKFIDAMQAGTPSVTTPVGAEGMQYNGIWNGKIEQDPEAFADAAVELYSEIDVWKTAQKNGFELLKIRYPKKAFLEQFRNSLLELQKNRESHRLSNFTGAMLLHHSLGSTRYLSKYIEAKNRLK
ncbi:glycosyltransferase [Salinimicrobium soli]|uniref:glycosyltransferase n=1 Tax=Salinimicrobium soli TaxID=1254399 RepID=UPI003AAF4ABE